MRSIETLSGGSFQVEATRSSSQLQRLQQQQQQQQQQQYPLAIPVHFSDIGGPTYLTAQTLIQQVAYALSDKLFTYSPETFDLDTAVKQWAAQGQQNTYGYTTAVQPMQTRQGAGAIALGYIFSKDFDLKKRHIPQSILASSATLQYLRPALQQLSLLYSVANPFVAHVAAVDYAGGAVSGLVADYTTSLALAEELGLGLVSSFSAHESQHMALFSTLLADILPTIHIYDGIRVGGEITRVIDVQNRSGLSNIYKNVLREVSGPDQKHLDGEGKLLRLLKAFNAELGTDYNPFEYHGHPEATSVLVSFGTVESSLTSQIATSLAQNGARVGVVNVRVYRPFVEEAFLSALPKTSRVVGVLGQVHSDLAVQEDGIHSALYEDVLTSLTFGSGFLASTRPECVEIKYAPSHAWSLVNTAAAFQQIVKEPLLQRSPNSSQNPLQLLDPTTVQEYTFWGTDDSASNAAAIVFGQALAKDSSYNVTTSTVHDNLVLGGITRTDIRKCPKTIDAPYPVNSADVVYVGDLNLLSELNVPASIKDSGKIIVKAPGLKDEDLEKKLPQPFRLAIAQRGISLFILDLPVSEETGFETTVLQAAFLRVALPNLYTVEAKKLVSTLAGAESFSKATEALQTGLRNVDVPESWSSVEEDLGNVPKFPTDIHTTSFIPFDKSEIEEPIVLRDWQDAAKTMVFKEAYGTTTSLRPDLAAKTFTIHVSENRRLTPKTYDRNIFHIEFNLGDTGLKYDLGEALGIHAQNNTADVDEFIKFYGLDPASVVEVPSREDPDILECRTIYQALVHNIDIFGRPSKRFYESLAAFASDEKERKYLLTLATAEGVDEFKRRAEIDTVTFADLLVEFPSAHPSFPDLVRIVSPMKRREYSIASCQQVTPNSVALMIVVVNWVDPSGRCRYGQASHYLSALKPGNPVTVSVKASVMKLPPQSTQPIIMAGLGTGLAPFRAFVQHRAMEKAQGKQIGSVLLYMGSRHQREEYCYGEEWEAYQAAGVITLLGRAFSRDQPQKIYIQDRMRETLPEISRAYIREQGAFYLCGPTWPVPDVTEVLEEAIVAEARRAGGKKVDARREIERLKDEMRFVLEVY
ncbi:sulfite reductase flavoprotein component [Paracoccidioides lutzii Pb01]|uniref:assimilatory sulfite reductase (NADPH) n=1 Tax=Paracoccidioides lutzii (strain ATCC MYA-826 / Pb01) TaxID=502779 RepID=C1HBK7_PARBA|nr:sulfite reductase flavoprotein component [Paracoccidioides lutzii Pb01]EEH38421.1 sulfite reductase flavoprotein component [Paracoccidioides lutzii Pb01]